MRRIILLGLVSAALGGCYTNGEVAYSGGVTATAVAPDLVYAAPGVQVIADYDEPIFYSDNFYWRYYGGTWYRSSWYTGGWVYASPPRAIVSINRPYAYVHYRPHGYVARNRPYVRDNRTYRGQPTVRDNRTYYRGTPAARDNRSYRPAPTQSYRPAPQSTYRGAPAPAPAPRAKPQPSTKSPTVRDHRRH